MIIVEKVAQIVAVCKLLTIFFVFIGQSARDQQRKTLKPNFTLQEVKMHALLQIKPPISQSQCHSGNNYNNKHTK